MNSKTISETVVALDAIDHHASVSHNTVEGRLDDIRQLTQQLLNDLESGCYGTLPKPQKTYKPNPHLDYIRSKTPATRMLEAISECLGNEPLTHSSIIVNVIDGEPITIQIRSAEGDVRLVKETTHGWSSHTL